MQRTFSWGKNSPLHKAGLGILEENHCTWVIFAPTEICNLKTKPKEHRNHNDDSKNTKPVLFLAFLIRIDSPKQTRIQQWPIYHQTEVTDPSKIYSVFKIRHPAKKLLFSSNVLTAMGKQIINHLQCNTSTFRM